METTQNNLDTFRILFIIKGILTLCFALIPIFYILLGSFIFSQKGDENGAQIAGTIMVVVGIFIFLFLIALGIITIMAGNYLGRKTHYTFIFVVAIINCFTGILGIVLGIFTLIELNKPHVRQLFEKRV